MMNSPIHIFSIAIALLVANSQVVVIPTNNTCQAPIVLASFNLTAIPPSQVTNGTCGSLYPSGGACVNVANHIAIVQARYAWLKQKAMDALNYNMQYANASLYFQVQNGVITVTQAVAQSTISSTSTSNSILSSITNVIGSVMSKVSSMMGGLPSWMQGLFNTYNVQVNPCFQAWQNLTDASHCALTSANSIPYILNVNQPNQTPAIMWGANPATAGTLLRSCNALLDTYCSLSYGVSVTRANQPFNATFNWGDGALSKDVCTAFAGSINATDSGSVLAINNIYMLMFHTNYMRFIPGPAAIQNLGTFLTNPSFNQAPNTFQPVASAASGIGMGIISSSLANPADFVAIAQLSGAPVNTYSVSKIAMGVMVLLISLIA